MYEDVVDLLLEPRNGEPVWTDAAKVARLNLVARIRNYAETILDCANTMENQAQEPRNLWSLLADTLYDNEGRRALIAQERMLGEGHAYLIKPSAPNKPEDEDNDIPF